MYRIQQVLLLVLLSFPLKGTAQSASVDDYIRFKRKGMFALGSWSVINIGVGLGAGLNATGENRYFWLGNAGWNLVNLGIAGAGLLNQKERDLPLCVQQRKLEQTLLLNIGLDIAYVSAGWGIRQYGLRLGEDQWKGYGSALLLQGVFLAGFDLAFYLGSRQFRARRSQPLCQLSDQFSLKIAFHPPLPHGFYPMASK